MRRQRIPILIASALGFIAICIAVIGAWGIFTEARSQTPALQEQMFPVEPSAAIEAQIQASAKLTRSASFDQRFRKLSKRAQKKGIVAAFIDALPRFPVQPFQYSAEELAEEIARVVWAKDTVDAAAGSRKIAHRAWRIRSLGIGFGRKRILPLKTNIASNETIFRSPHHAHVFGASSGAGSG